MSVLSAARSARSLPARPRFPGKDAFTRDLQAKVSRHLAGALLRGDPRVQRKGLGIALWFLLSYGLVLAAPSMLLMAFASLSWALAASALSFGVFHDANHGSFARGRAANLRVAQLCCVALGAGRYFWVYKHQALHHHAPNVHEWDDDLESRQWLRTSPHEPWRRRYRGQHLYFLGLYAFNSVEWFFIKDFAQYATGKINRHRTIPEMCPADQVEFIVTKAAYLLLFVLPLFLFQPPLLALAGFVIFHLVLSLLLTTVFQVAHLNDRVEFCPAGAKGLHRDHATHQLRTTSNFGVDSTFTCWFTGGLNLQIEHHLYPNISHTHYPAISRLVRETAAEHGLPYIAHSGLIAALASHVRLLRTLQAG